VDKLIKNFGEISAYNNWRLRRGDIDADEHTKIQRLLTANATRFAGFWNNIDDRNKTIEGYQAEGKDNKVNGFRSELLENMLKNFSVSAKPDGSMVISTIDDEGKVVSGSPAMMQALLATDVGADVDAALKDIIEDKGTWETLNATTGVKTETYNFNTEMVKPLVEAQVKGFTEAQIVDAALDLSVITSDKKEAERKDIEYVNPTKWLSYRPEDINELKEKVIDAMEGYTIEKYDLMFGSKALQPKADDESITPVAITKATDPGIQYADGLKPGAEYDSNSILGTMMTARGVKLTNSSVVENYESLDSDQQASFKKLNYDLFDKGGNYIGTDKSKVKVYALNTPTVFSAKELQDIAISSSSDRQWKSINGFVLVKNLKAGDTSGLLTREGFSSPYNIRIKGNVSSSVTTTKEQAGVVEKGKEYEIDVTNTEKTEKITPDVSNPLEDDSLFPLWQQYINKNTQIRDAFNMIKNKKESDGEDMNDPSVFRNAIGETLEMLQK
ncbi:MAG TPA: hypothetical protein DCY51_03560, partial [Bacteroidetes bacterium]|nr:hypothetical protein [Bacteroidota bacterium]